MANTRLKIGKTRFIGKQETEQAPHSLSRDKDLRPRRVSAAAGAAAPGVTGQRASVWPLSQDPVLQV